MFDIASHPVVNPRTFELINLTGAPVTLNVEGVSLPIASVEDLILLKLLAARDQDAIDVMLLCHARRPDPSIVVRNAERDDVDRTLARGVLELQASMSTGELPRIATELLGRVPTGDELDGLSSFLEKVR